MILHDQRHLHLAPIEAVISVLNENEFAKMSYKRVKLTI